MPTVVREGMFETNSSSSHALTLRVFNSAKYRDRLDHKDGRLLIAVGQFGWGESHHRDAITKASYALTWAMNYAPNRDEALEFLRKALLSEYPDVKNVVWVTMDGYGAIDEERGYIDHQSVDVAQPLFGDDITVLREFIFDPRYELVIDNDNH